MTAVPSSRVTVALCGDVMLGRGIDQVLPHPCDPVLYEPCMESAEGYVALAERASGPIARPVPLAGPWGDAFEEMERAAPDVRVVNLETAITRDGSPCPDKSIHYRVSPENAGVLAAARIDVCALANNHVLDWGPGGLVETLAVLDSLGVRHAGAGRDLVEAEAPAAIDLGSRGRVLVYSFALESSGVPPDWAAADGRPGVALLPDLSDSTLDRVGLQIRAARRRPGDRVVISIHWGPNWGFAVSAAERRFAHALVARAGADVVHGHSSHHVRGIEVHRARPILYGCGDFLNDYEGIGGYEGFRGELGLLYFVTLGASGALEALEMMPTRIAGLRVRRATGADAEWLAATLGREGEPLGTRVVATVGGRLALRWDAEPSASRGAGPRPVP